MALIVSAATGNFNAGATWVGGVVPTVGDEARAATGHTITITANATCNEVSNDGTGIFTLNSGVTLTANVTAKSTTINRNVVQFTAASPAVGTIVGNVTGATVSAITGAVNNTSSGTLNITGNATGGSGNSAFGCNNASTGTLTVTGNVTGGSNTSAYGCNNNSTGTLTITGNATGGSGGTAYGCQNAFTGTVTITGIATGGTTNGAPGVNAANAAGTVNVGRAKGNDFGIGSVGIAAGFGVAAAQSHIVKIKEIEYGLRGMSPTSGPVFIEPDLGNIAIFQEYPTGSKTLSDPNNTAGLSPAVTDVRSGVIYNNGNDTGTCAVPAASSVGFGVPVDATTGTAALTPASVWDHLLTAITASSTIGTLLKTNIDATISSRSTATTAGIAGAVWDEVLTGATHNINASAGKRLRQLASNIVIDGEVVSATSNTVTLDAGASSDNGAYDPALILITEGPGAGESRLILAYNGSTKTCVVDRDWKFNPTSLSKYVILSDPGREHVNEGLAQGGTATSITLNTSASASDGAYIGQTVFIRSGTGSDQARRVISYNGTTKVATVQGWSVTPDTTSAYVMLPTGSISNEEIASAVWDEILDDTTHDVENSAGRQVSEMHLLQGLRSGETLTVTPTSRTAGAISQTIGGDGTTTTTVSRD